MLKKIVILSLICSLAPISAMNFTTANEAAALIPPTTPWTLEDRALVVNICEHMVLAAQATHNVNIVNEFIDLANVLRAQLTAALDADRARSVSTVVTVLESYRESLINPRPRPQTNNVRRALFPQ
jgi:hypothetical protein